MRTFVCSMMLWTSLLFATYAHAQSTVIYQDDFEGSVSGWSDNSTDYAPAVTNFLGRFADGQATTSRTFTMPANTDELVIEFDLYRFDSWDNQTQYGFDRFDIEIDGIEIFREAFPNPQIARSGTTGNVDWSHTPLTGTEELGFASGQYWFDQLHRFAITVDTPGATVELTLNIDVNQTESDESGGFDNIIVTANGPAGPSNVILAVAENFSSIDGDSGGVTPSVLNSDTLNGAILNPSDVTITSTSSSSANITLNSSSGLITVAANTPASSYTVDYEICENIDLTNCSSVTETVNVFVSGGTGGTCPAGQSLVTQTGYAVSAEHTASWINGAKAVGQPAAEGTNDAAGALSEILQSPHSIDLDMTGASDQTIPAGTDVTLSLTSAWNNNGRAEILTSLDDITYTSLGTIGASGNINGAWVTDTLRYDDITVPTGGLRYIRVNHEAQGVRVDGAIYTEICQPSSTGTVALNALKTIDIYDPNGLGLYALPGNDVIYTISIDNTGSGDVDSESLLLIDEMPAEMTFYNGDIDDAGPETNPVAYAGSGNGLTFDYSTNVGFSDAAVKPTSFANCSYVPTAGYDPDVSFICFNPTGAMLGGSTWSVSFRSRIN